MQLLLKPKLCLKPSMKEDAVWYPDCMPLGNSTVCMSVTFINITVCMLTTDLFIKYSYFHCSFVNYSTQTKFAEVRIKDSSYVNLFCLYICTRVHINSLRWFLIYTTGITTYSSQTSHAHTYAYICIIKSMSLDKQLALVFSLCLLKIHLSVN